MLATPDSAIVLDVGEGQPLLNPRRKN
jgi:hypothetical protein